MEPTSPWAHTASCPRWRAQPLQQDPSICGRQRSRSLRSPRPTTRPADDVPAEAQWRRSALDETSMTSSGAVPASFHGNDRLLYGIILGVLTFWLFAQTTLNIGSDMSADLGVDANIMNIAVAATALFSGIFIVVAGGLADHLGRMRIVRTGFYLSIAGSLLVGLAPAGGLAAGFLL